MMVSILILALFIGAGVWLLLVHLEPERDSTGRIVARVDEVLPQTQCGQCSYAGCRPYAEAIVAHGESVDLCPPGGAVVKRTLRELLGRGGHTDYRPGADEAPRQTVIIDEARCIGCTKCIKACPVDAIVGAAKQMHTVIAAHCTGCELCIAPCPVDCIDIVSLTDGIENWRWPSPAGDVRERGTHA